MSQVTDQILSNQEAEAQAQIERVHEQKNANILAAFQAALQSSKDRRSNIDAEIEELEREVSSRMPAPLEELQAQG